MMPTAHCEGHALGIKRRADRRARVRDRHWRQKAELADGDEANESKPAKEANVKAGKVMSDYRDDASTDNGEILD